MLDTVSQQLETSVDILCARRGGQGAQGLAPAPMALAAWLVTTDGSEQGSVACGCVSEAASRAQMG